MSDKELNEALAALGHAITNAALRAARPEKLADTLARRDYGSLGEAECEACDVEPGSQECERCGDPQVHEEERWAEDAAPADLDPGRRDLPKLRFCYDLQVWTRGGHVLDCGHPMSLRPGCCYAGDHAGESHPSDCRSCR